MKTTPTLVSLLLFTSHLNAEPLKVFILAGQSNMEGHAQIETFDYIGDDPATAPLLKMMRGAGLRPAQGYELAGFVWLQGRNDMVDGGVYPQRHQPGGYATYSELLAHFIRDVRRDCGAPTMPFVIGVTGVGGASNAGYHYLGCAKTFALLGQAFAEENIEMMKEQRGR